MSRQETYDFAVIGGGIFGVYAALYLAGKGQRVILLEKENDLLLKASVVNQARLHAGYHYPRSIATARLSDDNKQRFTHDHRPFINTSFEKYYAIDRQGSLTDARQFERFCAHIGLRCERVTDHPLFNYQRLEAVYATTEHSFDPYLIARYYRDRVQASDVTVLRQAILKAASSDGDRWRLTCQYGPDNNSYTLTARQVINATYAATNAIHQFFGLAPVELQHEISEIALLSAPGLEDIGLTVMDGQFASLMPYGLSGLLSLSSVAYTHHKISYDTLPTFDCQQHRPDCQPAFPANCNYCPVRPDSHFQKMKAQIAAYLSPQVQMHFFKSLYTIKSKLRANAIDDGRPTVIQRVHEQPSFYTIFAGKINSIYEVEKMVDL